MKASVMFKFDAAHHLLNYDGDCSRPHGHTYKCKLTFEGQGDPKSHMVIDFKDVKKLIDEELISRLDHQDLNTIDTFTKSSPTAENLACYIVGLLSTEKSMAKLGKGVRLIHIELWETENCSVSMDLL